VWSMIAAVLCFGMMQVAQTSRAVARVDELLARDSVRQAALLADSILQGRAPADDAGLAPLAAVFGRLDEAAGSLGSLDPVAGTTAALLHLASGSVPESLEEIEARLLGDSQDDWRLRSSRGSALRAMTQLGFRLRGTGPGLFATADDPATRLLVHQAARDSAGVRELIAAADASARSMAPRNQAPPLALAEAELWLGDSAAALRRLLAFERRWTAMDRSVSWGMVANGWTLGRTWLLLADLARAQNRTADAERALGRVAALWSEADEPLRAMVERARVMSSPAAAASAGPVLLRPSRAGSEQRYRFDAVAWLRTPFQRAFEAPMLVARLTMVASERAIRTDSGTLRRQRFDSVALDLPVFNNAGDAGLAILRQAQAGARELVGETMTDERGRVIARVVRSPAGVPGELRRVLESQAGFGPLGAAIVFPDRPVAVGESWSDSVALYLPGGLLDEDTRVLVTCTLARLERIGGRLVAFIAIDAGTGSRPAFGGGASEATLSGELVWDVEASSAIRLAASVRAVATDRAGVATPARVLLTALRLPSAPVVVAARED